jgi:16S rRNA processing protein RimM
MILLARAMTEDPDRIVVMGEVAGTYGVRGWLKVRSFSESPETLLDFAEWWVRPKRGSEWKRFARVDGRLHSGSLVVALAGVESRESALAMKGFEVGVPRSALPAVHGEIYWEDLKGLAVVNRAGVRLGEVRGVVAHGAHPLLRVGASDDAATANKEDERLIPYVPAIVDRVDVAARRIDVDWEADY